MLFWTHIYVELYSFPNIMDEQVITISDLIFECEKYVLPCMVCGQVTPCENKMIEQTVDG